MTLEQRRAAAAEHDMTCKARVIDRADAPVVVDVRFAHHSSDLAVRQPQVGHLEHLLRRDAM